MATRSRIAIELEDGSVESIYCHWDGYPEGTGRVLLDHYTLPEKVQDLINLGSISSLAPILESTGKHSFDNPEPGVVVAYGRDRGEKGVDKIKHESVSDFFNGDIEEYGYLFTQEGEWLCKSAYAGYKTPVVIDYILSGEIKLS